MKKSLLAKLFRPLLLLLAAFLLAVTALAAEAPMEDSTAPAADGAAYTLHFDVGDNVYDNVILSLNSETATFTIPDLIPTKEGYVFDGWQDGHFYTEGKYMPGDSYTIPDGTEDKLVAVWHRVYTLTLDYNDQDSPHVYKTLTASTTSSTHRFILTKDILPVRDGYKFLGWSETPGPLNKTVHYYSAAVLGDYTSDSKTVHLSYDSSTGANGTKTLYAVWDGPVEYNISFHLWLPVEDDGSVTAPEGFTATGDRSGVTVPLSGIVPEGKPTDWVFEGWRFSNTASESHKDSIFIDRPGSHNITLYGKWKQHCTITYDINKPEGSDVSLEGSYVPLATEGYGIVTLAAKWPSLGQGDEAYTFLGWATSPEGPVSYEAGDEYKLLTSTTLYAVWETCTLLYDDNVPDEDIPVPSKMVTNDGNFVVAPASENPRRAGYVFKKWTTDPTNPNTFNSFYPGSKTGGSMTGVTSTTLYALWEPGYTLRYDDNAPDEEIAVPADNSNTSGVFTLAPASENPRRAEYIFCGWSTSPGENLDGTIYTAGQEAVDLSDLGDVGTVVTLYAVWRPVHTLPETNYTYSFHFDEGEHGGTVSGMPTAEQYPDQSSPRPRIEIPCPGAPTITGASMKFIGWDVQVIGGSYSSDGDKLSITVDEDNIDRHAEVIFTATWEKIAVQPTEYDGSETLLQTGRRSGPILLLTTLGLVLITGGALLLGKRYKGKHEI